MIRTALIVIFACIALVSTNVSGAIEIQNFKAGLVCEQNFESSEAVATVSWICFETETIYVTGQGDCVYDRRDEQCTWYGIEFDYTDATADDEIRCVSISTTPANLGNPKGITDKSVSKSEYEMTLEPGDGHEFAPGYSVSNSKPGYEGVHSDETVCSLDGEELFRYRFTTIYPNLDEEALKKALGNARIRRKDDDE